jgi:hypothetical protein
MQNATETARQTDAGIARAEQGPSGAYISVITAAIEALVAHGEPFDADDVWERLGDAIMHAIPNRSVIGVVMRRFARQGKIRCVGYERSMRPTTHGVLRRQWAVVR